MTDSATGNGESLAAPKADPRPDPVAHLGSRLRDARLASGMSLRAVARQLAVSPSFISQMENGKSQPSVATLYSMSQLLGVAIDDLFDLKAGVSNGAAVADQLLPVDGGHGAEHQDTTGAVNRSDFTSPGDAWLKDGSPARIQIVLPADRPRLVMDSGVIWEQLASNRDRNLDFMEITYPPSASSTNDGRMLRHQGQEYGLLLSGTLEITYGFETYLLQAGESMSLDPSVPHLLTNPGAIPARGIWTVHHCAPVDH